MSSRDKDNLLTDGYLVIISKWNFLQKKVVYKGSYYDDGILKMILKTKKDMGFNLAVFNVHTSGGTFGKSKEVVKRK